MSEIIKRKRGRPVGSITGKRETLRFQIKNWKPIHETIVTLHVLGRKNIDIAKQLQIAQMTVGNTINSDKGKERIIELTKAHNDSIRESQKGKIAEIKEASIDNIHRVVTNKELIEKRPLTAFDLSVKAMKVLEDISDTPKLPAGHHPFLQSNQTNNNQFNVLVTNSEFAERIVSGLDKLEEIKKLMAAKSVSV